MRPNHRYATVCGAGAIVAAVGVIPALAAPTAPYPWLAKPADATLEARVPPPSGFARKPVPADSFAAWLRGLPVKPGRPEVRLWNGDRKGNQDAQHVVLELDVGARDLQQCADAAMRLRAEFLRRAGRDESICFRFTDRTPARWTDWKAGLRPTIERGQPTRWSRRTAPDASYASFRRYLTTVFGYAGTLSLVRELDRVPDVRLVEAGDLFIQGGSPGHAVIVVDVAEDANGRRAVLLAQSYMPAQDIHVLRNPHTPGSPWYVIDGDGPLATPEWHFPPGSLRRFPAAGCPR